MNKRRWGCLRGQGKRDKHIRRSDGRFKRCEDNVRLISEESSVYLREHLKTNAPWNICVLDVASRHGQGVREAASSHTELPHDRWCSRDRFRPSTDPCIRFREDPGSEGCG